MTIQIVAELVHRQLQPQTSDENSIELEEIIEAAKIEYALQQYYFLRQQRLDDWWLALPSHLLAESPELDVVNNELDISDLKILRSMSNETWLQAIGKLDCECKYIKSTVNQTQLMCGDDSLPDGSKTFYIVGKKIKFPKGTHAKKLSIIYASDGSQLSDGQEIDESIAALVRAKLLESYGRVVAKEDVTNNSSSNS